MRSSGFDQVSVEIYSKRLTRVTLIVIVIFVCLILRLWFLQIVKGPNYRTQSENNRIHLQNIPPFRGMLLDRNGELLVDNRPSYNLYIIPEQIQDRDQLLKSLKLLVGLNPSQIKKRLINAPRKYPFKPILIRKNISRDELAIIETNLFNLPGVMIQVKPQRHYLYGEFASHLVGYLGEVSEAQLKSGRYPDNRPGDLIGKYGVEARWQKDLNGLRGGEQVEVDAAGRKLRVMTRKPPIPGLNISLTINKNLQMLAEKSLRGKMGAIVAMNPNNGEIFAMASSPAFNPNRFIGGIDKEEWKEMVSCKDHPLQNRAISGQYPPGSVFKIVVALAGLEEEIINPQEEIFCNGSYSLGSHTYHCWRKQGHGKVRFHRALVESCDTYFYKMGRRLGVDKIAHYGKLLGLGKKTDFGLDYEKRGLIPTREWKLKRWGIPWQAGETISLAIGQSFVLVTPIQMARLISTIFNGGHMYQPKIIRWVGKNNRKIYKFTPTLMKKMDFKKENLELIRKALIGVVNGPHGTGSRARVKEMVVAGKTGTAQVINLEAEKNLAKRSEIPVEFRDHAWFIAIAPLERPKIALSILIEHGGHGGRAAAPIAKEMIKAFLGRS
ncbi:MAG: penicillin-binding protein 2 [Deltaproteobacteria bacterium]|nr:penicillin-binding protein 2 [Deltaproteobacteria bacterium]